MSDFEKVNLVKKKKRKSNYSLQRGRERRSCHHLSLQFSFWRKLIRWPRFVQKSWQFLNWITTTYCSLLSVFMRYRFEFTQANKILFTHRLQIFDEYVKRLKKYFIQYFYYLTLDFSYSWLKEKNFLNILWIIQTRSP